MTAQNRIVVVGDSFSDAAYNAAYGGGWAAILGQRLGAPIVNYATGGAGYVAGGNGPTPARFSRQLLAHPDLEVEQVALVILFGSVNDWQVCRTDYYRSTVYATLRDLQREYPAAAHLIVGPQWSGPDPVTSDVTTMRAAVLEAMSGCAFPYPYVDPVGWLPPSEPTLWSPDRFHPGLYGHARLAERLEPHARAILGL